MNLFLGIDPGGKGAIAAIDESGATVGICNLDETPKDVIDFVRDLQPGNTLVALLEEVHSMPLDGVAGAFSFGWISGGLEWMLLTLGVRYEKVSPQKWQKAMACKPRGKVPKELEDKKARRALATKLAREHKNDLKAQAQALFPQAKVTLTNADALLLAEHCRRMRGA